MPNGGRAGRVGKDELLALYRAADERRPPPTGVLAKVGPLDSVFETFVDRHRELRPLPDDELLRRFDSCDRDTDGERVLRTLRSLSPGGGLVGWRQVNRLTEHYFERVQRYLAARGIRTADIAAHGSAFGSGGDFYKTRHATTEACMLASLFTPICKVGTRNVTSDHGCIDAAAALGYDRVPLDGAGDVFLKAVNGELDRTGFSFVSLAELGIPYSDRMLVARQSLWREWMTNLHLDPDRPSPSWHAALERADIPIDIFKVVSPNAQPLKPRHHSTGVCHGALLPYVLGIYLERGTTGMIVHGYDGIDELSVASSNPTPGSPASVVVHVRADDIVIQELAPEDLGLPRASLSDIVQGTTAADEAATFRQMLAGEHLAADLDFVVANAALLIAASDTTSYAPPDLTSRVRDAAALVMASIRDGRALEHYEAIRAASTEETYVAGPSSRPLAGLSLARRP